jgi:uncharacterized protein
VAEAAEGLDLPGGADVALSRVTARLAEARASRPMPAVDRALYADINGRFISAFARASAVAGDRTVLADARRAADRFLKRAYRPQGGVAHRLGPEDASGFGLLEDQVAFGAGLVELAGATSEPAYVTAAIDLFETVDREFRGEDGLLRDLSPRLYDGPAVPGVAEPSYPLEDSPHLSANAGAAIAWYRLSALVKDDRWRTKADALLPPIAARIGSAGLFAAGSAWAAGLSRTEPATVVVQGSGPGADRLFEAARRAWHPNAWVFRGTPPAPFSLPEETGVADDAGEPRALVCFGTSCAPPVTEPAQLGPLLARAPRPAP